MSRQPRTEKTLAMRILEGRGIPFEVHPYPESERDAEHIAEFMGVAPERVFKTLVAIQPGNKAILVMVPAHRQLDLRKLAKAVGVKKVRMATHKEAETSTGLQVGGISALTLLNRGYTIFIDQLAWTGDYVYVSAGRRGLDLKIAVEDLVAVTKAKSADVTA